MRVPSRQARWRASTSVLTRCLTALRRAMPRTALKYPVTATVESMAMIDITASSSSSEKPERRQYVLWASFIIIKLKF